MKSKKKWLTLLLLAIFLVTAVSAVTLLATGCGDPTEIAKPTVSTTSFVYNGSEQGLAIASNNDYTVSGDLKATDVGTYSVTVALKDKKNNIWKGGDSEDLTYTYTITQADNAFTTAYATANYTYGETPATTAAVAKFGTPAVKYYSDEACTTEIAGMTGFADTTAVGTYYVKVTVAGTANYKELSEVYTVVVDKIEVEKPTVETTEFTYNGEAQGVSVAESELYTVTGEQKQTDAGEYSVTVALKDKTNYKWADGDSEDLTIEYTIAKADNEFTTEYATAGYTYGAEPSTTDAVAKFGTPAVKYYSDEACTTEIDGMTGFAATTKAGTYYVKVAVDGTDNYTALSEVYTVVVSKAEVEKPTATEDSFVYDGKPHNIEVPASELYTVTSEAKTEKGTYTATVALNDKDNYQWADGNSEDLTLNWTISEVANGWTTEYHTPDYVFGGRPTTTDPVAEFGNAVVKFYSDEACQNEIAGMTGFAEDTPAGTYYVKVTVEGTESYGKLDKTYTVVVSQFEVEKPTVETTEFTYNGEAQGITIAASDYYTVTGEQKSTNAGTYTVTVALKDKTNYKWADGDSEDLTFRYTIAKATVAKPTLAETSFAYNGKEQMVFTAPADAKYTVSGNTAKDVGNNYTVTFALKDKENYAWEGGSIEDHEVDWQITFGTATVNDEAELTDALADDGYNAIKLGADITTTEVVVFDRAVTIDLNNKTLTYNGTVSTVNGNGNTVYKHGFYIGAAVTIENGSLTTGADTKDSVAVLSVTDEAAATLNDVDVKSDKGYGIVTSLNATVTITGGSVTAKWHALSTNNQQGAAGYTVTDATIESTEDSAIFMSCYTTVTLTNATVKGKTAIDMRMGELIVSGGTIQSTLTDHYTLKYNEANATGTRTGGDGSAILVKANFYYDGVKASNAISIALNNDPTITGNFVVYNMNDSRGMLAGKNAVDQMTTLKKFIADNAASFDNVFTYEVTDKQVIAVDYDAQGAVKEARVGSAEELRAAIGADYAAIKLENDVSVSAVIKIEREVTLDLATYTLSVTKGSDTNAFGDDNFGGVALRVNKGGNLTIKGENGTIDGTAADKVVPVAAMGGNVTIESGTIKVKTGTESCVFARYGGKVTIEGGTFINEFVGEYAYGGGAPLTLNVGNNMNGEDMGGTGVIEVLGGTFVGRSPEKGDDALGGNFVAGGLKVAGNLAENKYYVLAAGADVPANIDYVRYYGDAAVSADAYSADGLAEVITVSKIKLMNDMSVDAAVFNGVTGKTNGSLTLDLNTKALTLTTTKNPGTTVLVENGFALTIKNGNLNANNAVYTTACFVIGKDSAITFDKVTVESTGSVLLPQGDAAAVNVIDSTITTTGVYGVATNAGSDANYGVVITIKDSTIIANPTDGDAAAVMINVGGTLDISNSKINSTRQGVIVRAGNATLTNVNVNVDLKYAGGVGRDVDPATWGGGNEVAYGALVVGNNTAGTYKADAKVTVNGGSLNCVTGVPALANHTNAIYAVRLNSAVYSTNVTLDGVTLGGQVVNHHDTATLTGLPVGTQVVNALVNTANNLTAALNAGGYVKQAGDITADVVVTAGKTATLDLNGYTLTGNIVNNGSLEIKSGAAGGSVVATTGDTVVNNGTLKIVGGKFDAQAHQKSALLNNAGATVTITGGEFVRSAEAGTPGNNNGNSWYVVYNVGTFEMTGGRIEGTSGLTSTFINEGTANAVATAELGGDAYICGERIAVKNGEFGVMTISGGKYEIVADAGNNATGSEPLLNYAECTITGGEFLNNAAAGTGAQIVYNYGYAYEGITKGATLIISGGKFTAASDAKMIYQCVNSSEPYQPTATVTGGTFTQGTTSVAVNALDLSVYAKVKNVAQINTALAAEYVDIIKLGNDITQANPVVITRDVTIDLAGYTVTATAGEPTFEVTAGNVVIQNGNLACTGTNLNDYAPRLVEARDAAAKLTMNNVHATSTGYGIGIFTDAYVELNNCEITATWQVIATNNGMGSATVAVNGGKLTSTDDAAIYLSCYTDVTLTDVAVTGKTAVDFRVGKLTVVGGSLTSTTAHKKLTYDEVTYANGTYEAGEGSAVHVRANFYYDNNENTNSAEISISDSTVITGALSVYDMHGAKGMLENKDSVIDQIKALETFIAGFKGEKHFYEVYETNKLVVAVDAFGAGNTAYVANANELKAVMDAGYNPTLIADVTADVEIAVGKTATLDLGAYTLTGKIVNNGILTVKGSGKVVAETDHAIVNSGTLTVKGGTFDTRAHQKSALLNNAGATVTVTGGEFIRGAEKGTPNGANGNSWYVVDNRGTFTMTGGSIRGTSGYASTFINLGTSAKKATATFEGDAYVSGQRIVLKNDDWGVMRINGGTFEITANAANNATGSELVLNASDCVITGGEFINNAAAGSGAQMIYNLGYNFDAATVGEAVLTVTGGTFTAVATDARMLVQSACCGYGANSVDLLSATITGVTFTAGGAAVTDFDYTVYGATKDAGELARLVELGVDHITLTGDVTADVEIAAGKTVKLDLNGHKLTNVGNHTIVNKGNLTVTDTSAGKTGVIDNVTHAKAAVRNEVGATFTLEAGTLTRSLENGISKTENGGNSYYVLLNHGTAYLKGGSVTQNGHYSSMIENGWQNGADNTTGVNSVMYISGGTFSGGLNTVKNDDYGELTITGGTFTNNSQAAVLNWNIAEITGGTFTVTESAQAVILNGYANDTMDKGQLTVTGGEFSGAPIFARHSTAKNGGTITVNSEDLRDAALAISDATVEFARGGGITNVYVYDETSLRAAIAGGITEITLTKDFDLTSTIEIPANAELTLDLNGKTLTSSVTGAKAVINNGKLTVKNGVNNAVAEGAGGITCTEAASMGVFECKTGSTTDIYGGYYLTNSSGNGSVMVVRENATAVVHDGSFVCKGYTAAVGNLGKLTIHDGYFYTDSSSRTNYWSYCVRNVGNGEMTINKATVIGVQGGIAISGGTAVINDCDVLVRDNVFEAGNDTSDHSFYALYVAGEDAAVSCVVNGGKFVAKNRYALYVGNSNAGGDGGQMLNASIKVNGGDFEGKAGAIRVDAALGTAVINGGTYNSDVGGYVGENKVCVLDESTGKYEVIDQNYDISTAEQLREMGILLDKYPTVKFNIKLTNNIDLAGTQFTPLARKGFVGTFDGQGYTISNLVIDGTSSAADSVLASLKQNNAANEQIAAFTSVYGNTGLFGKLETPGTIMNLNVHNATVKGYANVGVIVGGAYTGAISNCHVTGLIKVDGYYKVGGITGEGYASINDCSVIGEAGSYVKGTYYTNDLEGDNVGGIVGFTGEGNGTYSNLSAKIDVYGSRKVGGLFGYLHYGKNVENSTYEGTVHGNSPADYRDGGADNNLFLGGIAGEYAGNATYGNSLNNCTAKVTFVTDNAGVTNVTGGIVGGTRGSDALLSVTNCHSTVYNAAGELVEDKIYDGGGQ